MTSGGYQRRLHEIGLNVASALAAKALVEKGQRETDSTSYGILCLGEVPPTAVVPPCCRDIRVKAQSPLNVPIRWVKL